MSIEAILFDLGGILLDIDYTATSLAFKKLGAEQFDEYYTQNKQGKLFDQFETGRISPAEFRTQLNACLQTNLSDQDLDNAWNAMVGRILPGRLAFIAELKLQGYRIFLYSNTNAIHYDAFLPACQTKNGTNRLDALCDAQYYSHIFGKNKPFVESFQHLAKEIEQHYNLVPAQILFIDDTKRHIEGAKQAGFQIIHLPSNLPTDLFQTRVYQTLAQPYRKIFQQTTFAISAAKLSQCPLDSAAEVAFMGRSNVGKSSTLNALTYQKNLAKTSKTPGRTQLINFFKMKLPAESSGASSRINFSDAENGGTHDLKELNADNKYLVDLPGFGYAKVAKSVQQTWAKRIDQYLRQRNSLCGLVLIMDIRHPLQPFDQQMLHWAITASIPVHIVLNKLDKLASQAAKKTLRQVQQSVRFFPGVSLQLFSATHKTGIAALQRRLAQWLSL